MMEHYLPGRADLVAAGWDEAQRVLGRAPDSVLDLGGGPGTTVETMLRRWPASRATVLDVDPVLLALAREALPASVTIHPADLRMPGWAVGVRRRYEVVLVVMTLHFFPAARIRQLYREVRAVLAPDGLLLVVEPMPANVPGHAPGRADSTPAGCGPAGGGLGDDPWGQWWRDRAGDPAMGPLLAERARVLAGQESAEFVTTVDWHRNAARVAGYARSWLVRRHGDHALLALTQGGPAEHDDEAETAHNVARPGR